MKKGLITLFTTLVVLFSSISFAELTKEQQYLNELGVTEILVQKGQLYIDPNVKTDNNNLRYSFWLYKLDNQIEADNGLVLQYITAISATDCVNGQMVIITGMLLDPSFNVLQKLPTSDVVPVNKSFVYQAVSDYVCKP